MDCATPAGEHLANVRWDRKSGTLMALSRPLRLGRSEPGKALSEKEASARAVRWLRLLGVFGNEERDLRVVRQRAKQHWDFRVVSFQRRVRILVERRTGELVVVSVLRADGLLRRSRERVAP